jgi:hypothetical protein
VSVSRQRDDSDYNGEKSQRENILRIPT